MWNRLLASSLDVIYPPKCHYCNVALDGGNYICDGCYDALKRLKSPFCERCSESFEGIIEEVFVCPNCAGMKLSFDFARSALMSTLDSRKLVYGLKYKNQYELFNKAAELMKETFQEDDRLHLKNWFLVPVPMHWTRQFKRGYNQSEELTRMLAHELELPWGNMLKRVRATKTQTKLGRRQRHKNLKGCFEVIEGKKSPLFQNILLIDDVLTTGFTAHYCAESIRQSLAPEQLSVLTLVRG